MGRADLGLHLVELPPNRPDCEWGRSSTAPIRDEQLSLTCDVVQEPVLVAEHSSRTHDGGIREGFLDELLAGGFGTVECRGRVVGCIQVRDVYEAFDPRLSSNASDELCTLRVDVIEAEVPV